MTGMTARTDPSVVALRLRQYMGGRKITRSALAALAGINQSSLGQKLDNRIPFTYDEMDRVLPALGLTWHWLVFGDDDNLPSSGRDI
jgi:transcriptional regulator with XRE-family HTH domain